MSVPEGYKVVGEEERVSSVTGRVYSVQLLKEEVKQDSHVAAWRYHTKRTRDEAERRAKLEAQREERRIRKEAFAEANLLRNARPAWWVAAKELRAIGFTTEKIAQTFDVTEYQVKKMFSNERKIKSIKNRLNARNR